MPTPYRVPVNTWTHRYSPFSTLCASFESSHSFHSITAVSLLIYLYVRLLKSFNLCDCIIYLSIPQVIYPINLCHHVNDSLMRHIIHSFQHMSWWLSYTSRFSLHSTSAIVDPRLWGMSHWWWKVWKINIFNENRRRNLHLTIYFPAQNSLSTPLLSTPNPRPRRSPHTFLATLFV